MDTEFVIGIIEDNLLGFVLKPFLIRKLEDKGFYPIEAQLSEFNIDKYEAELTAVHRKIFQLSQEYSENSLCKVFGKRKGQTTKDFIGKLDPGYARDKIRPYIEKRHKRIVEELRKTSIEVYFKDRHKFINKSYYVSVMSDYASVVFNIIKEEETTRYFLSIDQNGQAIHLKDKSHYILSNSPCCIVVEDQLYSFEEIDAKKLLPFFTKDYITIPKKIEENWYKNFALPNIKKHQVNAEGFDIEIQHPQRKAVLSLVYDLTYNPAFVLYFYYGKEKFVAQKVQNTVAYLEIENGNYKIRKIERDLQWEESVVKSLEELGLACTREGYFSFRELPEKERSANSYLIEFLQHLQFIVSDLKEMGVELDQSGFDKYYLLDIPEIDLEMEEDNDWFDIRAIVRIGTFVFPFVKLKKNILNGISEFQLPDGSYALIPPEWFSRYNDLFKFGVAEKDRLRLNKHHFKILEKSIEQTGHGYLERLKELSQDLQEAEIEVPAQTASILRHYQVDGYKWMSLLHKHRFGGCLADDMGLGKTLQTLTLLLEIKNSVSGQRVSVTSNHLVKQLDLFDRPVNKNEPEPEVEEQSVSPTFLIVMPTSLVHNWENEINKFTPQFSVYKYTGIHRTKNTADLYDYDIVLTSYGIVRNDVEELRKIRFYYIILDESQHIKNPSSKIYKAVTQLESNQRLVLTGTPIENSLSDLWAQLNFLNKGLLGNYGFFKNEFIQPIEKHKSERQKVKLQAIIDPFMLRRTKYQVAKELPEKTEQIIYCDMTDEQKSYYESEKSKVRNSLLDNLESETSEQATMKILEGLSILRQAANHPVLVEEDYQGDSGKFEEITDYIQSIIAEDHKVLVFSSYKKHLTLLEKYLEKGGWKYSLLTGETRKREEVVAEFQNDPGTKIFLIQIKAGGFGLNLTAADYVLILDPWWNPAVEEQAVNRAHRIGQDKNVIVYRFISVDTVEEKISRLQDKKARLAETFITPSETIKNLSREQIMDLFS